MNQPVAAQRNFQMFCKAMRPLLATHQNYLQQLDDIQSGFAEMMQDQMHKMWAAKLGLSTFDTALFSELEMLMQQTPIDYTIFFRELSTLPDNIGPLKKSFYRNPKGMEERWLKWLTKWKALIDRDNITSTRSREELSRQMKLVNPKYSLREWFVVPAYQQAAAGNYTLLRELQEIMTQPYAEQSREVEEKYYKLKPFEFFEVGGLSYYSCSS